VKIRIENDVSGSPLHLIQRLNTGLEETKIKLEMFSNILL